jgi:hypothetical protein
MTHTPVAVHMDALAPPITVWCVSHPKEMAVSAEAQGVEVVNDDSPSLITFGADKKHPLGWANQTKPSEKRAFEDTCRAAFVAFSHSAVDVTLASISTAEAERALHAVQKDNSLIAGVGNDALLGLGGVLMGGVLAAGFGAVDRRRSNRLAEGKELEGLDGAFRADLYAWLASPSDETSKQAKSSAIILQDALRPWCVHGRDVVDPALKGLTALLNGVNGTAPYIGYLGGSGDDLEAAKSVIRERATGVKTQVGAVATFASAFWRRERSRLNPGG